MNPACNTISTGEHCPSSKRNNIGIWLQRDCAIFHKNPWLTNVGGVLTLTSAGATATLVQWEAALHAVTYTNTSDDPLTATRDVTFAVNDGTSASNTLGSTISLTAINDAAVLAGVSNLSVATNAVPTAINTVLTLTDVDSTTAEYGKVTLTNFMVGEDVLGFTNNGLTMGNIAISTNATGVLTLVSVGGTASLAEWEAALHAVTYANVSVTPTLTVRNVTFEIQNGLSISNDLASTVTLTPAPAAALDTVFAQNDLWV